MTTWHDIESARDQWIDAPLDDDVLEELLAVAEQQVIAYAPALPAPAEGGALAAPVNYLRAQLQQARNLWNASKVDAGTGMSADGESFAIRPFPLDWMIRQTLRPRRGVPRVR